MGYAVIGIILLVISVTLFSTSPSSFAASSASVSVPSGSSVPGCEETNECWYPAEVTVDVGGTVTWSNDDSAAHTVTSVTSGGIPDGIFDSSLFLAGTTFSHKFQSSGTFDYICIVHPWMQGSVIVQGSATPSPTPTPTPTPEPTPGPAPSGTDVIMPSGTSVPGCENSNSCFVPSIVSVATGKSLTWYNADSAAHTVTSGNSAYPSSVGAEFDSGLFLSGSSFSHVFDKSDTIDYFCIVHPWMQGTVIVGSGDSTPPPAPIPTGPAITVTTDKSSYKSGNIVRISGEVRELLSGFPVTLQVIGANGNIVALEQVTVTSFKKYSKSLVDTDSPVWGSTGTYTVKVLYGTESRTAQTTFYFTSSGSSVSPKPIPTPEPYPSPSKPGTDITVARGSSVPGCENSKSCYSPYTYRTSSGQTVTWYNADSAAHTVTSGHPSSAGSVGAQFDSSLFLAGSTFSHKFQSSGTFDYFCIVHPWMSGQVIVDGGGISGSLSISTDKSSYNPGDLVNIQAKVSGSSRANVAVSVTDSSGDNILSRTISTGSSGFGDLDFKLSDNSKTGTYNVVGTASIGGSTEKDSTSFSVKSKTGLVSIVSLEATDQQGNTVSSFSKGKLSFAKVILSSDSSVSSLVTVNLFDSELTSLGIGSFKTTLPGGESEMTLSFFIPNDASSGTANIYANVFSDWPSNGGIPLTGESSVSVTIR